jgi:endo-1,4-beta-xylanase
MLMPHPSPAPRFRWPSAGRRGRQRLCGAGLLAALTAGVLAVLGPGTAAPALAAPAAGQTLDQLAKAKGRYFGSAASESNFSDTAYASILGGEFGQVTPENSMKWDTVEPTQGQFNYARGDQVVAFAQQHNQIVRGHNLVWHSQLPGWVSGLPTAQVKAAMENHITQEVTHYKGKIYAWDVVNEPFNDDGTLRGDAFYQAMGTGYIADALRTARAADPAAKLYLNDYNIEGTGAKSDAMYNLVKSLKSQGVPIDGVGFETHLAIQYGFPTSMQQNLQRFADLGVDVAVTELDVRMQLPRDATKDATQSTYYTNVVKACLAVTRCVGITAWGFTDKYSWVPGTFSGQGAADLYDEAYQPKPAYNAVVTALGGSSGGGGGGGGTGSSCAASFHSDNDWGSGFTATVTVTNTGSVPISSWRVTWTWAGNQRVTNAWSTTLSQSGQAVTASSADYNGSLAPGASTSFGFQASYSGGNSAPTPTCTVT